MVSWVVEVRVPSPGGAWTTVTPVTAFNFTKEINSIHSLSVTCIAPQAGLQALLGGASMKPRPSPEFQALFNRLNLGYFGGNLRAQVFIGDPDTLELRRAREDPRGFKVAATYVHQRRRIYLLTAHKARVLLRAHKTVGTRTTFTSGPTWATLEVSVAQARDKERGCP